MRQPAPFALGALGAALALLSPAPLAGADAARDTREASAFAPQARVNTAPTTLPRSQSVAPVPVGTDYDMYCSGFLGPLDQQWVGAVVSAAKVEAQTIFMETDILYVDIGENKGVIPGQEFWIHRPDEVVYRYDSLLDEAGRIYMTQALARVVCVQEASSIVEIVRTCGDVQVGDVLLPFEPMPIPLVRRTRPYTSCEPGSGKLLGHILQTKDRVIPIGDKTIVFLDLGEGDGIAPGDFFTVFRTRGQAKGVRTILGELAVLKTQPHTAVAVVTLTNDAMFAGDEIELK
jgi:hypothetical protein